jgi:predicted tellurium resistance membrane protein TerC
MFTDILLNFAEVSPPAAVEFLSAAGIIALLTLSALEIVLGIDNVIFIAILTDRLPQEQRARVRTLGLMLAMVMRLVLLALAWLVMKLQDPLFTLPWPTTTDDAGVVHGLPISGKDLVLILGGLFLIAKATFEIHHSVADSGHHAADPAARPGLKRKTATAGAIITQILLLDLVFSLDSVITAVGMTQNYWIMSTAVVVAVGVMLVFAGPIANFVSRHPSMKTLALAFLVLIGVLLLAEGMHQHLSRGYVYFAMAFALSVELINIRAGSRKHPLAPAESQFQK